MSIRLRLTLLYTTILALTLIVFSAIIYGSQSQPQRSRSAGDGGTPLIRWRLACNLWLPIALLEE